jgi:hypothetical protein
VSALLPILLPIAVVIDRIEPPMAIIEWPSGELSDVPLAMFPPEVAVEGARLLLQPSPTGLLSCPQAPLPPPPPATAAKR